MRRWGSFNAHTLLNQGKCVAAPEVRFLPDVWSLNALRHFTLLSKLFPLLAVSLICCAGCEWERPTVVSVRQGPVFVFSGNGRLATFTVYAPHAGQHIADPSPDVAMIVWQVKASKGYFEGARVGGMQLSYGKVPGGYSQTVPESSQQAPAPMPGAVYSFFAETTDAPGIGGFFYVGRAGLTQITVPDLCLKLINGRAVAVKCGTNNPYQEPADLEKFAQEHQLAH